MILKKTTLRLSCLLALVGGLTACAGSAAPDAHRSHSSSEQDTAMQQDARHALSDYHWQLAAARDAQGRAQPGWLESGAGPATLRFVDGRVFVSGLCNGMSGQYSIQEANIRISRLAGTMKLCANETLMRYEQQFGLRLPQAERWQIEPGPRPMLVLSFIDGAQWAFEGRLTHEAMYGPGETIFLEVAPRRVACSHPLKADHQCLQVRDIAYDASGVKRHVGDWYPFYDEIEDYRHEPGVRNVLRVKRYTRAQVPADASPHVYVLDLVVESENLVLPRGQQ